MAPRIVRIELKIKKENDKKLSIEHEFESSDLTAFFTKMDRDRFFKHVKPEEDKAKANTNKRHSGQGLGIGDRVRADDFEHEPDDIHAGIHLRFNDKSTDQPALDEIVWFTKEEDVNFIIDIGLDAALIRLRDPLPPPPAGSIKMDDVLSDKHVHNSPFDNGKFPAICAKGVDVKSGPIRKEADVKDQQFYKWHARVLSTDIVLDPHIECHDD